MKKAEVIIVSLTFILFLLIFIPLPGTRELFGIGMSALSMIYFYLSFALTNKIRLRNILKKASSDNIKTSAIILSVVVGVGLSIALTGILFKMLHLPGAGQMLIIGIFFLLITGTVGIILHRLKSYNAKPILTRALPVILLSVILYFPSNEQLIRFIYRSHPNYADAYIKFHNDPENSELEQKFVEQEEKAFGQK